MVFSPRESCGVIRDSQYQISRCFFTNRAIYTGASETCSSIPRANICLLLYSRSINLPNHFVQSMHAFWKCPALDLGASLGHAVRYQAVRTLAFYHNDPSTQALSPTPPISLAKFNPRLLPKQQAHQSFSTTTIFGTISRKASLSLSFGSKPSLFSAVSEMYRPMVPQARTPRPTVRRVRGERFRKDLIADISSESGRQKGMVRELGDVLPE